LDIYPPAFGLAAFLFLLYDRDRMQRDEDSAWWARPWRLAAGLAAGAATASKWTGGLFLIGVIVLTIVWEVSRRRDQGLGRALGSTALRELPTIVLYLGLAPFALYVLTYLGRLHGPVFDLAEGSWIREWLRFQTNAFSFHRTLETHHGYESPPATWLLIKRPLMFWSEQSGSGKASIYAMGNPLIWWPGIVAFVYLTVAWVRDRDWTKHRGFILAGFTATYLVWLVLAPRRDAVFLFYVLPAIPFLCLAVAAVVERELTGTLRKVALVVTAVFSVGWFFAYYPIMTNQPISHDRWDAQMFFKDCKKPDVRRTKTATVTQAVNRNTTIVKTNERVDTDNKDIPPLGWCWI
jgi:dolichyl-phosphate-mannose--protein O-mannosyl transferase